MNSIKNTIVTVTLLAVGYGAYTVLNHPPTGAPGDLAMEEEAWTVPTTTEPATVDVAEPTPSGLLPAAAGSAPAAASRSEGTALPESGGPASPAEAPAIPQWPNPPYQPGDDVQYPAGGEPPSTPPATEPGNSQNFYAVTAEAPAGPTAAPAEPPATAVSASPNASPTSGDLDGGSPAFEEAWKSIDSNLTHGQLADALFALTVWYEEPSLSPAQSDRLVTLLDQLAGTVIYSRESFLEPAHVVQEGETLAALADSYGVSQELLARINGIPAPYELYPGETLKVVRGPFRAEVSRDRGEITLFLGRHYAGRFRARIGADLPASDATYEVVDKEPGRAYFDRRTGYRVEREDPENPYGSVWIGLRGDQVTAAHNVGIHADGGNSDAGCIAVTPVDAADLMAILSVGSRVVVKR